MKCDQSIPPGMPAAPCNVTKSPAIILSGTVANLTNAAEGVATFNLTNGKNMSGAIQLHTADLPEWFENGAMITLDTGAMKIRLDNRPTP